MAKIAISRWARKPNHPRFYVTDGREPLGLIFESRGIYTAVTTDGDLVIASRSIRIAADALTARAS
jgi:hypothetical protein